MERFVRAILSILYALLGGATGDCLNKSIPGATAMFWFLIGTIALIIVFDVLLIVGASNTTPLPQAQEKTGPTPEQN